jgi:hypothetical protein
MRKAHFAAVFVMAATICTAQSVGQNDWPQLNRDAGRTACSPTGIAPPFRARWIWCGPDQTLRNKASNPAWPDDLAPANQNGADYPMPARVPFTLAGRVQPIVANGKVYVGDMDGRVYAISLDDGATLWVADNPGGTCGSVAVVGNVVVATAISGGVTGFDAATGRRRWRIETPKAITGAILALGDKVFSGCHDGKVYAIDAAGGKLLWTTEYLGAPIVSDLCGDESVVYVGAENLWFYKLDIASGKVLLKTRLMGQSFRMLNPVLYKDLLFVQTVQAICPGSEYVMEGVMRDSPDIVAEQRNILRWLAGDTNGGQWPDASPGWKHLHVLRTSDLVEPFIVPNGPADGCGSPAPPPVVTNDGRVLAWFKTRYPTLTKVGSFGTRYSMDISAIDLKDGHRVPIDNGRLSGTTGETDNLFNLSVGGDFLYMRQRFRGTKLIDLKKSTHHAIQAAVYDRDGGRWPADVVYRQAGSLPRSSQPPLAGREAVVIAGDKLLFTEEYGVVCVEHRDRE